MKCDFDQVILALYTDGVLGMKDMSSCQSHLAGCEECSEIVAEFRDMAVLFKDVIPKPIPHSVLEDLRAIEPTFTMHTISQTTGIIVRALRNRFAISDQSFSLIERSSTMPNWILRYVLFV